MVLGKHLAILNLHVMLILIALTGCSVLFIFCFLSEIANFVLSVLLDVLFLEIYSY